MLTHPLKTPSAKFYYMFTKANFSLFFVKLIVLHNLHYIDLVCAGLLHLIYLCGHNNPIIGFRPALKLPSRRLCFARASSTWSHHSKSRPLQLGLYNGYAVVPPADGHQPPQKALRAKTLLSKIKKYCEKFTTT